MGDRLEHVAETGAAVDFGKTTIFNEPVPTPSPGLRPSCEPRKLLELIDKRRGEPSLIYPILISRVDRELEEMQGALVYQLMGMVPLPAESPRVMIDDEVHRFHVGRTDESDIVADDMSVSRRHAAIIRRRGGKWSIVDEGSTNGTFLDGRRLEPHMPVDVPSGQAALRFGPKERFLLIRHEPAFRAFVASLRAEKDRFRRGSTRFDLPTMKPARPSTNSDRVRTTVPLSEHQSVAQQLLLEGILRRMRAAPFPARRFVVALEEAIVEEFDDVTALARFVAANFRRVLLIRGDDGCGRQAELYRRPGTEAPI